MLTRSETKIITNSLRRVLKDVGLKPGPARRWPLKRSGRIKHGLFVGNARTSTFEKAYDYIEETFKTWPADDFEWVRPSQETSGYLVWWEPSGYEADECVESTNNCRHGVNYSTCGDCAMRSF